MESSGAPLAAARSSRRTGRCAAGGWPRSASRCSRALRAAHAAGVAAPRRQAGQRPARARGDRPRACSPTSASPARGRHHAHPDRRWCSARPPTSRRSAPAASTASAASDLWSLGATLYAAVEGRAPHDRVEAMAALTAVLTEEPAAAAARRAARPGARWACSPRTPSCVRRPRRPPRTSRGPRAGTAPCRFRTARTATMRDISDGMTMVEPVIHRTAPQPPLPPRRSSGGAAKVLVPVAMVALVLLVTGAAFALHRPAPRPPGDVAAARSITTPITTPPPERLPSPGAPPPRRPPRSRPGSSGPPARTAYGSPCPAAGSGRFWAPRR